MQKRRKNLLDTMLMKYPDLELVGAYGSLQPGMADEAYEQTRAILRQHPDLQAIWVTWDEFNRGVVSALKDEKRSDVRVYSFDLCDSEIELMTASDSPWAATVAVDPGEVGRILIRLAAQVAYGGQLERQFAIPMKLVLPEMLRNAGRKVLQPEGDLACCGVNREVAIESAGMREVRHALPRHKHDLALALFLHLDGFVRTEFQDRRMFQLEALARFAVGAT